MQLYWFSSSPANQTCLKVNFAANWGNTETSFTLESFLRDISEFMLRSYSNFLSLYSSWAVRFSFSLTVFHFKNIKTWAFQFQMSSRFVLFLCSLVQVSRCLIERKDRNMHELAKTKRREKVNNLFQNHYRLSLSNIQFRTLLMFFVYIFLILEIKMDFWIFEFLEFKPDVMHPPFKTSSSTPDIPILRLFRTARFI